ncbi:MAG: hypothetical protein JOY82_20470 [Streptosporangiaceae bacterium]|nr:hypothetical protein [Streptosporangiaceae bacterium]MBV9856860.1 hypothetical protein [Streptosporangiaceae bacterium]
MTGRYAGARSLCYGTAPLVAPLADTALYNLSPAALWCTCAAAGICAAAMITPGQMRSLPAVRQGAQTPAAASVRLPLIMANMKSLPPNPGAANPKRS